MPHFHRARHNQPRSMLGGEAIRQDEPLVELRRQALGARSRARADSRTLVAARSADRRARAARRTRSESSDRRETGSRRGSRDTRAPAPCARPRPTPGRAARRRRPGAGSTRCCALRSDRRRAASKSFERQFRRLHQTIGRRLRRASGNKKGDRSLRNPRRRTWCRSRSGPPWQTRCGVKACLRTVKTGSFCCGNG